MRVIAPAHSFSPKFNGAMRKKAAKRLKELGLTVSFGKYVDELNNFKTTTVERGLKIFMMTFRSILIKQKGRKRYYLRY